MEQPLQASERPLRATGPEQKSVAASQEALIQRLAKTAVGERRGERPALLIAVLSTVHAGGEQGWDSGHLEPFFVWPR